METSAIWDQMAGRYDTEDRASVAEIIVGALRSQLGEPSGKTALDYGCGTGLVGFGLIDLFQSMLFVDTSARMLEQVAQKIQKRHIEFADTLCGDLLAENPPVLQADYVILSQVLLHIPDTKLILTRVYDVVNPGGHLLIVDFDRNDKISSERIHNGFEQEALIDLLKQIGFPSACASTFYHGKGILMNQDASLFLLHAKKP